jgi:hypothetical protein
MDNLLEAYLDRGLSTTEAAMVVDWCDRGRPGVARLNLPFVEQLYVVGYSVQEIHENFPEFPFEAVLWAKAQFKWDEKRDQKKRDLARQTLPGALDARLDGIRFVTEIINATHVKWRNQIIKYMANPEREAPPECLPKSLHQYGALQELLQTMMGPPEGAKNSTGSALAAIGPLVNVTIANGSEGGTDTASPKTIEIKSGDAKQALKRSLGKDKK